MEDNYLLRTKNHIIRAIWCVGSEDSVEYLLNLDTNEIIAKRVDGKIVEMTPKEEKL